LQRRTPSPVVVLLPPSDKLTVCAQYAHLTSKGCYVGDPSPIQPANSVYSQAPLVEKTGSRRDNRASKRGRAVTHSPTATKIAFHMLACEPATSFEANSRIDLTTITPKDNEPLDVALRRFRRAIENTGLLKELRARMSYEKPTAERKRKKAAAVARQRQRIRRSKLPKKMY